jgi:hypothetical protein
MRKRKNTSAFNGAKPAPKTLSLFFPKAASEDTCQLFVKAFNRNSGEDGAKISLANTSGTTATFNIEGDHPRRAIRPIVLNSINSKLITGIDFDSRIAQPQ